MFEQRVHEGSSRTMTAQSPGYISVTIGDYWSAGDKGRSPQPIVGMGRARYLCAIRSFELAYKANVRTHFIAPDRGSLIVREFQVPNHEPLSGRTHGEVLPLEFIWRRFLKGSLWQRVVDGEVSPAALGFRTGHEPAEGELLPRLWLECTTKYEPVDRLLTDEEARDLARLTYRDWDAVWQLISRAVDVTNRHAEAVGFYFPDGKMEIGRYWQGDFVVVDTFGTPDENRIIRQSDGENFDKDLIRNYLKQQGYMTRLKAAKRQYPKDPQRWPDYPELPEVVVALVSSRYAAFAAAYGG